MASTALNKCFVVTCKPSALFSFARTSDTEEGQNKSNKTGQGQGVAGWQLVLTKEVASARMPNDGRTRRKPAAGADTG
jgi:hypothetical protein